MDKRLTLESCRWWITWKGHIDYSRFVTKTVSLHAHWRMHESIVERWQQVADAYCHWLTMVPYHCEHDFVISLAAKKKEEIYINIYIYAVKEIVVLIDGEQKLPAYIKY